MPLKARKTGFVYADGSGSSVSLPANGYFSRWIDMSSFDNIVIYNSGGQDIELRGSTFDVEPGSAAPSDANSLPMTRYPSGSPVVAVGNRNTIIPGPLPRWIALKNTSGTTATDFLGYVQTRKIS